MRASTRVTSFVLLALAAVAARADEPPAADGGGPAVPPPAADGTRSVVVPDGTAPPADPPAVAAPPDRVPEPGPAATLLAEVLEPPAPPPGTALAPADAALFARPLTLLEAVQRPGDASRRLWVTQAYWKVSVAYAQVRWSAEAIARLELVAPGADPHDRATLDVASAAARADLADARVQLGVAQQDLVDLARLPLGEPLPWPVDRPLAGPYQTHFETIFAARVATGRVRAIARTLASRHEALESRAAAVRAAARAVAMAEADHAKGRRPIEAVIAAHAALVGQQREFLGAARAYNVDIAEYAMAVADAAVPDDRFVSMLIGTPIQWRPQTVAPATLGPGTTEAVTPAQATLPE